MDQFLFLPFLGEVPSTLHPPFFKSHSSYILDHYLHTLWLSVTLHVFYSVTHSCSYFPTLCLYLLPSVPAPFAISLHISSLSLHLYWRLHSQLASAFNFLNTSCYCQFQALCLFACVPHSSSLFSFQKTQNYLASLIFSHLYYWKNMVQPKTIKRDLGSQEAYACTAVTN